MDEYDTINKSRLKFKGEKKKKNRAKEKPKEEDAKPSSENKDAFLDAEEHGGWWAVEESCKIREEVVLEFLPGCYAKALNSGKIVLGNPHPPGEEPDEEEIFMAMAASSNRVAFKTGFGRYFTVDKQSRLMGLALAVGERESFSTELEGGCWALRASNGKLVAPDGDSADRQLFASSDRPARVHIRIPEEP